MESTEIALFKMNVLDYFIFSADPSRERLDEIESRAKELKIVDWIQIEFPDYFA